MISVETIEEVKRVEVEGLLQTLEDLARANEHEYVVITAGRVLFIGGVSLTPHECYNTPYQVVYPATAVEAVANTARKLALLEPERAEHFNALARALLAQVD